MVTSKCNVQRPKNKVQTTNSEEGEKEGFFLDFFYILRYNYGIFHEKILDPISKISSCCIACGDFDDSGRSFCSRSIGFP